MLLVLICAISVAIKFPWLLLGLAHHCPAVIAFVICGEVRKSQQSHRLCLKA